MSLRSETNAFELNVLRQEVKRLENIVEFIQSYDSDHYAWLVGKAQNFVDRYQANGDSPAQAVQTSGTGA